MPKAMTDFLSLKKDAPLVHIVLFGVLLGFVLIVVFGRPSVVAETNRVIISQSDVAQIQAAWAKTWQREPTPEELKLQLANFVRDEVMYREAVRLGFDKGDPLVRHSLKVKMEFLAEAQVEAANPSDDELQAYYSMRKDRYRKPPEVSFVHIYFSTDKRGARAENDVTEVLNELVAQDADLNTASQYGDSFMLRDHYVGQVARQLSAEFGDTFTDGVMDLEAGSGWQGPIRSAFGLHLVNLYDREEGYLPPIDEIRDELVSDLDLENRKAFKELFYTELLKTYQIEYSDELGAMMGAAPLQ